MGLDNFSGGASPTPSPLDSGGLPGSDPGAASSSPAFTVTGDQAEQISKAGLPTIGDIVKFKVCSVSEDDSGKTIGFDVATDDGDGDELGDALSQGDEENPTVGGDKEDSLPTPGSEAPVDEGDGKGEQDDDGTEERILGYKRPKKKGSPVKPIAKSLQD